MISYLRVVLNLGDLSSADTSSSSFEGSESIEEDEGKDEAQGHKQTRSKWIMKCILLCCLSLICQHLSHAS